MSIHFDTLRPGRPTEAALEADHAQLLADWSAATEVDAQQALIHRWDRAMAAYESHSKLAGIRFCQDTTESARGEDKAWFDGLDAGVQVRSAAFLARVLASPHAPVLRERLGAQAFHHWQLSVDTLRSEIQSDLDEERRLETEYTRCTSGLGAELRGTQYNLAGLHALLSQPERALRQAAAVAIDGAMAAASEQLDALFDQLVQVRTRMARTLGHPDFVPMGYQRMSRDGYGEAEVDAFRAAVRTHISPIKARLDQARADALGLRRDELAYWDMAVSHPDGAPKPKGDAAFLTAQARTMFARMGPDFAGFFGTLESQGLMDLLTRPGKAPGGFCDFLPEQRLPFIYANFTGTQDDVLVFTHEVGHAFQSWQSREVALRDLVWPTYEGAEIHSMSLELLTHPHMELFFGEDAPRYRTEHLAMRLGAITRTCQGDEFQHRIYRQTEMDADARAALWATLGETYGGRVRMDGLPHLATGRSWHRVMHFFSVPFYYIDYALAQMVAFQLWRLWTQDPEAAMAAYRHLCTMGGTRRFTDMVAEVGLANPLDPATVADVATAVAHAAGVTAA